MPNIIKTGAKIEQIIVGGDSIKTLRTVQGAVAVDSLGININTSVAIPLGLPIGVTTGSGINWKVGLLTAGGTTSGLFPQLIAEFEPAAIKSKQQGSVSVAGNVVINPVDPANCIVFIYGTSTNRTSSQAQYAYFYASLLDATTLSVGISSVSYTGVKGANWTVLEFQPGIVV